MRHKRRRPRKQFNKGDFNIFEGRTVVGVPSHTVSQGRLVFVNGDLRAERGGGRYINRPAFGANFATVQLRSQVLRAVAVQR